MPPHGVFSAKGWSTASTALAKYPLRGPSSLPHMMRSETQARSKPNRPILRCLRLHACHAGHETHGPWKVAHTCVRKGEQDTCVRPCEVAPCARLLAVPARVRVQEGGRLVGGRRRRGPARAQAGRLHLHAHGARRVQVARALEACMRARAEIHGSHRMDQHLGSAEAWNHVLSVPCSARHVPYRKGHCLKGSILTCEGA